MGRALPRYFGTALYPLPRCSVILHSTLFNTARVGPENFREPIPRAVAKARATNMPSANRIEPRCLAFDRRQPRDLTFGVRMSHHEAKARSVGGGMQSKSTRGPDESRLRCFH